MIKKTYIELTMLDYITGLGNLIGSENLHTKLLGNQMVSLTVK